MDSLVNYGSDDCEDSSDEGQSGIPIMEWQPSEYRAEGPQRSSCPEKQADANYEEVQMDLSEESNDGSRNSRERRDRGGSYDDKRDKDSQNNGRSRKDYRSRKEDDDLRNRRSRSKERKISKEDDRTRDRKDDRYVSKMDKYNRDDKSSRRDTYRDKKYRRSSSRDRRRSNSREGRSLSKERRRSRSRDRRRSSSREKRYSRSPKRDRSRRSRSRSRSRGRYSRGTSRRYGYPKNNLRSNEFTEASGEGESGDNKNRFFMPGITGKYREQIEKRKLLWQKKDPQKQGEVAVAQVQPSASIGASTSRATKLWETTTFAQDQDGKVASKFKRLMGIKGQTDSAPLAPTDIIKKQEEMFSSMEQQYEVARTATHTMRGVGLGFSSSYPR